MTTYKTTRISNYDGFKRLDKLLEKVAEGHLRPPRTAERDFYCPLCHYRKKTQRLVRSEVLGTRLPAILHTTTKGTPVSSPFDPMVKFIVVCEECAAPLLRQAERGGAA